MSSKDQESLALEQETENQGVVCLGHEFRNDAARREYFTERLKEYLSDPEFRSTAGFPEAVDEDILRLSDPPYYTACPNPFLQDFVEATGQSDDEDDEEDYHREPFAVDVSEGKTDQLYRAHSYHTKVPHLAIAPSILHYTAPGDLVLDAFAGSGMTGVAAQWCGTAPEEYRRQLESRWKKAGRSPPEWGTRRAIVGDLGPAPSFIAANYNLPFDVDEFGRKSEELLQAVEEEVGWMYETRDPEDGSTRRIEYTVWSEVFICPECAGEVVFVEEALDPDTKKTKQSFPCPHCSSKLTKNSLEEFEVTAIDPVTGITKQARKRVPVFLVYAKDGDRLEKDLDQHDREKLERIGSLPVPPNVPANPFPIDEMYHGSRLEPKGVEHVHDFYFPRQRHALASLWRNACAVEDRRLRNMLLYFVEQTLWTGSLANAYRPTGFSQNSQYFKGVYYIPSQHSELSPWYMLENKRKRLIRAFSPPPATRDAAIVTTGDCAWTGLQNNGVDYVFTDPPFGQNIPYADLNFLTEAWHGVLTDAGPEAIVDQARDKTTHEYQQLMQACFNEYYRVLKPGRWMTVVFSNSSNAIWRAIQEAIGTTGFVVADVRTLDKQQGSYRQVTSSAVKQDLVISAYKPTENLTEKMSVEAGSESAAWAFISEHLSNIPVFIESGEEGERIVERTPQMLHDRMVAFHVQRGAAVPLSSGQFFEGLPQRFPERDGMYFLPEQVAEYDRKRAKVSELKQLDLFVTDEASAIQWIRQELSTKPQTFQDLQPEFMQELQAWAKHERTVELKEILEQNFLCYVGEGPVPSQIHSYLSTNYKDLRNLEKDDPRLIKKAEGRWYVPDPNKQGDLEKLRARALLKEFEQYKEGKKKLKEFRTEAVRAGFKAAYDERDYETIVSIAKRLPELVLQEDEKLLMYYDVASMRMD